MKKWIEGLLFLIILTGLGYLSLQYSPKYGEDLQKFLEENDFRLPEKLKKMIDENDLVPWQGDHQIDELLGMVFVVNYVSKEEAEKFAKKEITRQKILIKATAVFEQFEKHHCLIFLMTEDKNRLKVDI